MPAATAGKGNGCGRPPGPGQDSRAAKVRPERVALFKQVGWPRRRHAEAYSTGAPQTVRSRPESRYNFGAMSLPALQEQFGQIDIYLFDQLAERPHPGRDANPGRRMRVRSEPRLLSAGRVRSVRRRLRTRRPWIAFARSPASSRPRFRSRIFESRPSNAMSFDDACADVVISSAVLHFARDDAHFERMLRGSWRVLKPGGLFFCRLASSIGMESQVKPIEGRRCRLPDGSERYLVDAALLASYAEWLGAELADPLKTSVVRPSTLDDHMGPAEETTLKAGAASAFGAGRSPHKRSALPVPGVTPAGRRNRAAAKAGGQRPGKARPPTALRAIQRNTPAGRGSSYSRQE